MKACPGTMRLIKILLSVSIIFTGLFGDYVVFRSKYSESQLFRAAADTTVHAAIGFLSACLFFTHRLNLLPITCIYNTVFCTMLSSIIDIDHFIVAQSINLKVCILGIDYLGVHNSLRAIVMPQRCSYPELLLPLITQHEAMNKRIGIL